MAIKHLTISTPHGDQPPFLRQSADAAAANMGGVNRTCVAAAKNANSMLYGACARAAFALGYRRLIHLHAGR